MNNLFVRNWRQNVSMLCLYLASGVASIAHGQTQSSAQKEGYAAGSNSTATVAAPGTVKWVVSVDNRLGDGATVSVTDSVPIGTTYVPGSLQAPPGWTKTTTPAVGTVTTVAANGSALASGSGATLPIRPGIASVFATVPAGAGDGYRPIIFQNNVYTIFHHGSGNVLYCADIASGALCPGFPASIPKTAGAPFQKTPSVSDFTTQGQFPEYVDAATGKLYFFARGVGANLDKPVVVCANLLTNTSCGMYVFSNAAAVSRYTDGGVWGTRIYSQVMDGGFACFDTATGAPCTGTNPAGIFPFTQPTTPITVFISDYSQILQIGSKLVFWTGGSFDCVDLNTANNARCAGASWPTTGSAPGTMFPSANSSGVEDGFCLPWQGATPVCYSLTGATQTKSNLSSGVKPFKPYFGSSGQGGGSITGWGTAVLSGGKTYWIEDGTNSKARCWDWTTNAACAGFVVPTFPLVNLYEAVVDPYDSNCVWALGHNGVFAVFNATTGGTCSGASPKASGTATPSSYYCDGRVHPITWGQIRIEGLIPNTDFTSATITLKDQNGNIVTGPTTLLASVFPYSLSGIPAGVSALTADVSFSLTGTGGSKVGAAGALPLVVVTWNGDAPQVCFETQISCSAPELLTNTASVSLSRNGTSATFNPTKSMQVTKGPSCFAPFSLSKIIAGNSAGQQGATTFSVTCAGSTYGPYTVPAGATGTQSVATIPNLPVGSVCTATELTNGVIPGTGASSVSTTYTTGGFNGSGNPTTSGPFSGNVTNPGVVIAPPSVNGPVVSQGGGSATFTNTYPASLGSLIINKRIAGGAAGQQGAVTFTANCGSAGSYTVAAGAQGAHVVATIANIPAGAVCTVSETNNGAGATLSVVTTVSVNNGATATASTGSATIAQGATATIDFVNTYEQIPTSVQIYKTMLGTGAGTQGAINITAVCGTTNYGPFNVPAGYTGVGFSAGPIGTITGLAPGTTCTITETLNGAPSGQSVSTSIRVNSNTAIPGTSASVVTLAGAAATVEVINVFDPIAPVPALNHLALIVLAVMLFFVMMRSRKLLR